MLAGAKVGILGAIIGGILLGPPGLLLMGAVGMAAGWWLSKESNK